MSSLWAPMLEVLNAPVPRLPLHLPSHGRGRALAPALKTLLRQSPGRWDLPELPGFGGPLEPTGAVVEAQRRCAQLLGAEHCWFGVNGASGLLQAALLALSPPGSRVLLPRNLHRSLLHGCVLGQLQPLLFDLPFDPLTGLWLPPSPAHLETALTEALLGGPVSAVALVDPTYHGFRADLPGLLEVAHRAGLPVLVDQAHGTGEAVAGGADLVVLSPQKTTGGLAQGAALLASGPRIRVQEIERALLWLQTSSPSALLLMGTAASIGHASSAAGRRQTKRAQDRCLRLRQRLQQEGFQLAPVGDPLRLVVATAPIGISGVDADAWLIERGVVAELPEPGSLTFCPGLAPPRGIERLLPRFLLQLRRALGRTPLPPFTRPPLPQVSRLAMPLPSAWRAPSVAVPLADAIGQIAAEPLCPYPPGIPLLVPGERIDRRRACWLQQQQQRWPGQMADTVQVVAC